MHGIVAALMENCAKEHNYSDGDTLVFVWEGNPEQNPFEREVDFEFTNSDSTWQNNLRQLQKQFGVKLRIVEEVIETAEIRLMHR